MQICMARERRFGCWRRVARLFTAQLLKFSWFRILSLDCCFGFYLAGQKGFQESTGRLFREIAFCSAHRNQLALHVTHGKLHFELT